MADVPSKTKSVKVLVSENIDVVHELIMQDGHVTYREIELSCGKSSTNIHSILHEQLALKNVCSH